MAPAPAPPPAEPWVPPTPISPREDAAANKRSRVPLIIVIVLALVAAAVIVVLLAGGDDDGGGSGTGEVTGELSSSAERIVTREVSVPAGSALVVRGEPDEDLDLVVSVLCDDELVDAIADLADPLSEIDPDDLDVDDAVIDAISSYVSIDPVDDLDELEEDEVGGRQLDELPSIVLMRVDEGYSGEEEAIIFLAPVDSDVTVTFTGYDGDEGTVEANLDIVDLGVEGDDPDDWAEAVADSDELADLVR